MAFTVMETAPSKVPNCDSENEVEVVVLVSFSTVIS
jgi:hypothetical protein